MTRQLLAVQELPIDERAAIEYALSIKDRGFAKNSHYVRQALLIYLADPFLKKPDLKKFAYEHGVRVQSIYKLRRHPSFQREFRAYIRQVIGGDSEIRRAYQELVKAVRKGEPWAVKKMLEDTGVMEHVSRKEVTAAGFDEIWSEIKREERKGKIKKSEIIDAEFKESG